MFYSTDTYFATPRNWQPFSRMAKLSTWPWSDATGQKIAARIRSKQQAAAGKQTWNLTGSYYVAKKPASRLPSLKRCHRVPGRQRGASGEQKLRVLRHSGTGFRCRATLTLTLSEAAQELRAAPSVARLLKLWPCFNVRPGGWICPWDWVLRAGYTEMAVWFTGKLPTGRLIRL